MADDTIKSAFPHALIQPGDGTFRPAGPGMTLREWFAGQTGAPPDEWMNAFEAAFTPEGTAKLTDTERVEFVEKAHAAWRKRSADALLVALEEPKPAPAPEPLNRERRAKVVGKEALHIEESERGADKMHIFEPSEASGDGGACRECGHPREWVWHDGSRAWSGGEQTRRRTAPRISGRVSEGAVSEVPHDLTLARARADFLAEQLDECEKIRDAAMSDRDEAQARADAAASGVTHWKARAEALEHDSANYQRQRDEQRARAETAEAKMREAEAVALTHCNMRENAEAGMRNTVARAEAAEGKVLRAETLLKEALGVLGMAHTRISFRISDREALVGDLHVREKIDEVLTTAKAQGYAP